MLYHWAAGTTKNPDDTDIEAKLFNSQGVVMGSPFLFREPVLSESLFQWTG